MERKRQTMCVYMCYRTGYGGKDCEISVNECEYAPSVCLNEGVCQDSPEGYRCLCGPIGAIFYTGESTGTSRGRGGGRGG